MSEASHLSEANHLSEASQSRDKDTSEDDDAFAGESTVTFNASNMRMQMRPPKVRAERERSESESSESAPSQRHEPRAPTLQRSSSSERAPKPILRRPLPSRARSSSPDSKTEPVQRKANARRSRDSSSESDKEVTRLRRARRSRSSSSESHKALPLRVQRRGSRDTVTGGGDAATGGDLDLATLIGRLEQASTEHNVLPHAQKVMDEARACRAFSLAEMRQLDINLKDLERRAPSQRGQLNAQLKVIQELWLCKRDLIEQAIEVSLLSKRLGEAWLATHDQLGDRIDAIVKFVQ